MALFVYHCSAPLIVLIHNFWTVQQLQLLEFFMLRKWPDWSKHTEWCPQCLLKAFPCCLKLKRKVWQIWAWADKKGMVLALSGQKVGWTPPPHGTPLSYQWRISGAYLLPLIQIIKCAKKLLDPTFLVTYALWDIPWSVCSHVLHSPVVSNASLECLDLVA